MNTRRGFFKQLASGLLVVSAPSLFLPKLIEPVRWKVNPAWVDAECGIVFHQYESTFFHTVPSFSGFLELYAKTAHGVNTMSKEELQRVGVPLC